MMLVNVMLIDYHKDTITTFWRSIEHDVMTHFMTKTFRFYFIVLIYYVCGFYDTISNKAKTGVLWNLKCIRMKNVYMNGNLTHDFAN